MIGAGEKDQLPVRRNLAEKSLRFKRTRQAIGVAGKDQDRHIFGNSADRL